jgi:hypothetical protein
MTAAPPGSSRDVRRRTRARAGRRADRRAEDGSQEQHADQPAPDRAAGRAAARERWLVELHRAVRAAFDDDEIVELDEVRLLRLADVRRHLPCGVEIGVGDCDEVAHDELLFVALRGWDDRSESRCGRSARPHPLRVKRASAEESHRRRGRRPAQAPVAPRGVVRRH